MRFLICLFLFCSTSCFAQNKVSDEEFINSIYKTFVDTSFTKYYISAYSEKYYLSNSDLKDLKEKFKDFIPDSALSQILSRTKTDTISEKWNCQNLVKAQCLEAIVIDTMIYFHVLKPVKVKKGWSERKIKKEEDKQFKLQEEQREKRPKQERTVYYFTKPIYSSDNQYAIMSFRDACGWLCGSSVVFLFKNENGKWVKIAERMWRES